MDKHERKIRHSVRHGKLSWRPIRNSRDVPNIFPAKKAENMLENWLFDSEIETSKRLILNPIFSYQTSVLSDIKKHEITKSARLFDFWKETSISDCNDLTSRAIGDFGRWQLRISVLMALLKLPLAWYQLNIIFMAPPQEFWCVKPETFKKYTNEEWHKICSPLIQEHPCLIFDPEVLLVVPTLERKFISLISCPSFVYDTKIFKRTITSDWNLVCSKHWLTHFTQCVIMCGVLLGGIIFGIIADKYGRKTPLMTSIVLQAVASYVISVMPWFWGFMVTWFILALASGGIGIISFVICMEVVGGKWRTTIPVLYHLPFGLGNTVMAGLAYWLRDWRMLEFALATISSLFIFYWFAIPESPRWLLATGQTEKAIDVLANAAEINRTQRNFKTVKNDLLNSLQPSTKPPGFMAFIKSKHMRLITLLLSVNWFCTGLEFYTFSQYLGAIGGNIFLTVALTGLISIPGGILCVYIITKFGRKSTVWIFQGITAACFLLTLFIPNNIFGYDWPRLLIAGIGFAGMAGTVPALYLYSGELFPTLGRNAGVGGVTIFARIASMIAPMVVSLDDIIPDLPLIILSVVSFGHLFLLVPLPETKDRPLPDTLEQAEHFK